MFGVPIGSRIFPRLFWKTWLYLVGLGIEDQFISFFPVCGPFLVISLATVFSFSFWSGPGLQLEWHFKFVNLKTAISLPISKNAS